LKIAPQSIALAREPFNGNIKQYGEKEKWQSKIYRRPKTKQPCGTWLFELVSHDCLGSSFFKEFFQHAISLDFSLYKGLPMIVHWDAHDLAEWDAVHTAAAGALQQGWDYGSSLKLLGVPVLRARVLDQGQQIAQAQFIVRQWGKLGAVALCTRGPIWSKFLVPEAESIVYMALKKSLPLTGIRFMAVTPEVAEGQAHGLHPMRRIMSGMSTVMLDISLPISDIRAQLEGRWRTSLVSAESSAMTVHFYTFFNWTLFAFWHHCAFSFLAKVFGLLVAHAFFTSWLVAAFLASSFFHWFFLVAVFVKV